jgi:hypothetical protein
MRVSLYKKFKNLVSEATELFNFFQDILSNALMNLLELIFDHIWHNVLTQFDYRSSTNFLSSGANFFREIFLDILITSTYYHLFFKFHHQFTTVLTQKFKVLPQI